MSAAFLAIAVALGTFAFIRLSRRKREEARQTTLAKFVRQPVPLTARRLRAALRAALGCAVLAAGNNRHQTRQERESYRTHCHSFTDRHRLARSPLVIPIVAGFLAQRSQIAVNAQAAEAMASLARGPQPAMTVDGTQPSHLRF
jgi:preprotein translocase subunit YajC